MKLRHEEFVPYAPEDSDVQIHINHTHCEAGIDNKKRLYIRRLDDGITILAHCHHCGKSGYYCETKYRSLSSIKRSSSNPSGSVTTVSLPNDLETDLRKWPTLAKAWVYRYGITDEELKRYGIGYSEREGRVVLPSWEDGKLVGYQSRKVQPTDTGPKYYTYFNKKNFVWSDLTGGDTVVICEDILSAIKLRRFYSSIALLSTYLHDNVLKYLFDKKVFVYLDNNNPTVVMQALRIKQRVELFVPECIIIPEQRDPKTLSNEELKNLCHTKYT